MAENEVNNGNMWMLGWVLIIVGAVFSAAQALKEPEPQISWRTVSMDGHRSGARPVTASNISQALGTVGESVYIAPSGAECPLNSAVALEAAELISVQPSLAQLKTVIGHSAGMYMNLRNQPDLPLGNLVADVFRAYGSRYFKRPMDFAITNYGGIRVPMPEGEVTLDDISAMFPFKNYLCYVSMKGENLTRLLEQLAGTKAFQPVSGCEVRTKGGKLVEAKVGGQAIDPQRIYHVTTIDFLLDGGDRLNIGALAENVVLSHVLLKDVMLDYVCSMEACGEVIRAVSDGRVKMEE